MNNKIPENHELYMIVETPSTKKRTIFKLVEWSYPQFYHTCSVDKYFPAQLNYEMHVKGDITARIDSSSKDYQVLVNWTMANNDHRPDHNDYTNYKKDLYIVEWDTEYKAVYKEEKISGVRLMDMKPAACHTVQLLFKYFDSYNIVSTEWEYEDKIAETEKYKQKKIEEEKELNKKYEELKKEYNNLFES